MKTLPRFLLVALIALLPLHTLSATPASNEIDTGHAEVELESQINSVQPGEPFWLSLEFEMEPGWHIYWKNPGDSGLAPKLNWQQVPEGFKIKEVHWPAPERIEMEGLVNYGYHGVARLLIPVIPPKKLSANGPLAFRLKASWLICKEICIPESEEFSLALGVNRSGPADYSGDRDDIERGLAALPAILEQKGRYRLTEHTLSLEVAPPHDIKTAAVKSAYFYPELNSLIDHAATQELTVAAGALRLSIPHGTQSPDPGAEIGGVLQLTLQSGETHFYAMHFSGESPAAPGAATESPSDSLVETLAQDAPPLSLALAAASTLPSPGATMDQRAWLEALLFALLGGLLLNAMPCVFPVLSLKALAISKKAAVAPQEVKRQAFAYLAGVLGCFLLMGGLLLLLRHSGAALGWGFQLQSAGFVTAMMYLFLLLGASLAGLFDLPMMFGSAGQNSARQDSLSGSFLTGALAVLVATPCTVPFMAPAVGYAFTQPAPVTLSIMAALGLGLASPYLLISFFPPLRAALPTPGPWMLRFKEAMGFLLFASAAWLLWVLSHQTNSEGLAVALAASTALPFLVWLSKGKGTAAKALLAATGIALAAYSIGFVNEETLPHGQQLAETVEDHGKGPRPIAFDPAMLETLRAQGKPVFVNATAAWCITCKVNERLALKSARIAHSFDKHGITYMKADWTNYDEPITRFLDRFGRQGVPLYVYYPPQGGEPVILPQLLTESLVLETIEGETP